MATMTLSYPRQSRPLPLLPLLVACMVIATIYCAHAVQQHSIAAEQVRACMNTKGPVAHLVNPGVEPERHYFVCEVEPGKFGIQILIKDGENWKEVSSFLKNKLNTLSDVIRYIKNGSVQIYQFYK